MVEEELVVVAAVEEAGRWSSCVLMVRKGKGKGREEESLGSRGGRKKREEEWARETGGDYKVQSALCRWKRKTRKARATDGGSGGEGRQGTAGRQAGCSAGWAGRMEDGGQMVCCAPRRCAKPT